MAVATFLKAEDKPVEDTLPAWVRWRGFEFDLRTGELFGSGPPVRLPGQTAAAAEHPDRARQRISYSCRNPARAPAQRYHRSTLNKVSTPPSRLFARHWVILRNWRNLAMSPQTVRKETPQPTTRLRRDEVLLLSSLAWSLSSLAQVQGE